MTSVDSGDISGTRGKMTISPLKFAVKLFASRSFPIRDPDQDSLFCVPTSASYAGATVLEYYGHPTLSGNVNRTPKIQFQILTPHSKTHTGLTFDAPECAPSVSRGNENPDVELECKTFPPNSALSGKILGTSSDSRSPPRSTPERYFSRTKTFRVSPCLGLRKMWTFGIIRQSYENFSNQISGSYFPFQDASGTNFSRSKAFKVSPCLGLRKMWTFGIIRQSYENFSNQISGSYFPFQDASGTNFSRSKAFKVSPCRSVSKMGLSGIIR
ncbi:hypothetical protein TNCV_4572271 [Trichonephila clavipes]|nr:hypothetical protein TNCV_4572271 [Trichonephila clavipes]